MSRAMSLLVAALIAVLLTPTGRAEAAYSMICRGYSSCASNGYSNGGYQAKQYNSYWAMYTGTNCTNYVAYRLISTNGMPNKRPKPGVGNARDWGTTMSSITNSTPTRGSVAWWGSKVGGNHVAYVEKVVSSSEIWVSESNWGGPFDWRKITKGGSGWPQGFIHFKDPAGTQALTPTTKPTMASAPKAGTEVKVATGTWSPSGTNTYKYQWLLDGEDISGATSATFTPTDEMIGDDLSARVITSRSGFKTSYLRTPAAEVLPTAVTSVQLPKITGTPREGRTLTASTGTWSPATVTYSYRWIAGSTAIPGATSRTYVPGPEQVGQPIKVQVGAKHPDIGLRTARSVATEPVSSDSLTPTAPPTLSGDPRVGSTVTANPGTWLPSTDQFSYKWLIGGKVVTGATGRSLALTAADAGKSVVVQVAAKHADYAMRTARSANTTLVAPGVIARGSRPVIKGTPKVGSRLTSSPGTWNPAGSTLKYRWIVGNDTVAGVTGPTFTPRAKDAGHSVTVLVTASHPGYSPRQSLAATRVVVPR